MATCLTSFGGFMFRIPFRLSLLTAIIALGACAESPSAPFDQNASSPTLVRVVPANATTGVDPMKPVTITFSHPMMTGMEMLVVLHEGTTTGPQVAGTSRWSVNRTELTFTPGTALKSKTTYMLHLSPSLRGTNGQMINMAGGVTMGGQFVTAGMMGSFSGGMMNGQWGSGMTGAGWQASNGTFGMYFTFTTA